MLDNCINKIICGDWTDVLSELPGNIFHCCITSPPYWGQRNYGVEGQLGLEKTPEEHIEKLVMGFRQVHRVLRDDGVLWLNYGDKYNGFGANVTQGGELSGRNQHARPYIESGAGLGTKSLKSGDLIGLAWRLALALQADGWYLRSDTIWAKALSFCDKYSGSTMPESLNGWRWERHKIKVKAGWDADTPHPSKRKSGKSRSQSGSTYKGLAKWQDCPGCPKCEPNGGLVLRKGSWRPTRAHEYLFLLTKSPNYFCDLEAVREAAEYGFCKTFRSGRYENNRASKNNSTEDYPQYGANKSIDPTSGRNLRDVWCIGTQAYPDAHYATFPEKLIEPCIKVSTSQKGCCPKCGAPWARIVDSKQVKRERQADRTDRHNAGDGVNSCGNTVAGVATTTLGWLPTCGCEQKAVKKQMHGLKTFLEGETSSDEEKKLAVIREMARLQDEFAPVPCTVFDPFTGSGTVAAVAASLGRNYCGIELNPDYIKEQAEPRITAAETGISKAEQKAGQQSLFQAPQAVLDKKGNDYG